MLEIEQLERTLFPADATMTLVELYDKLQRAERGECTYGRGREYDVDQMVRNPTVLEIRLSTTNGEDGPLHVRVYFTEPEELPGALVGLKVGWKRPGPLGLEEQNEQAAHAEVRADRHVHGRP